MAMELSQYPEIQEQIITAYKAMAKKAKYRPAATSDGCGNITVPPEQLNIHKEAEKYAVDWWKEEDACKYHVGTCSFSARIATIFAVEAARLMCGGPSGYPYASKLLDMAVQELKRK